jgi:hypothetical protein
MTNLIKIAQSVAIKVNRNSLDDYLSIGDKLMSELSVSAIDLKKEEILTSIALVEGEHKYYSEIVQQQSTFISALAFFCISIVFIVREYDIDNQNTYYAFMTGIIFSLAIRVIFCIRRQSISFYTLGSLTQLADKNIRE